MDDVFELTPMPRWYPRAVMLGVLRLLVGLMNSDTKTTEPTPQMTLKQLLEAAPDSYRFTGRYNEPAEVYDAIKALLEMGMISQLERRGNEAYRYHVLVPVDEPDRTTCIEYVAACERRMRGDEPRFTGKFYPGVTHETTREQERMSTCKYCGEPIVWAQNQYGNPTPLNPDTVAIDLDSDERQHILVQARFASDRRPTNLVITPGHAFAASVHTQTCIVQAAQRQQAEKEREETEAFARLAQTDPLTFYSHVWSLSVGEDVWKNTKPHNVRGTSLAIAVRSKAWKEQIDALSETILKQLQSTTEHLSQLSGKQIPAITHLSVRVKKDLLTESEARDAT